MDALAAQCRFSPYPICPLIDARKSEVFAAFFDFAGDGQTAAPEPRRVGDYLALPPAELATLITTPTLLLGSGAELYRELLQEKLGKLALFAPPALFFPRAAAVGHLALAKLHRGELLNPAAAVPLYVRDSDAQLP